MTITVSATTVAPAVREDFTLSPARTLTIAANETTSTGLVTIMARDNADDAPDKSVTVSGTADDAADTVADPVSVTLTITDDDDPVSIPMPACARSLKTASTKRAVRRSPQPR